MNFQHVSGGVSGTSASIIASGGANFSICNDYCGSLILSGNFCGVYALRPTPSRSCRGWHCRTISDTKQIFEIASGYVEESPSIQPTIWYLDDLLPYEVDKELLKISILAKKYLFPKGAPYNHLMFLFSKMHLLPGYHIGNPVNPIHPNIPREY